MLTSGGIRGGDASRRNRNHIRPVRNRPQAAVRDGHSKQAWEAVRNRRQVEVHKNRPDDTQVRMQAARRNNVARMQSKHL